jgi:hypothetical protein
MIALRTTLVAAAAALVASGVAAGAPTTANLTILVGIGTAPRPPLVASGSSSTVRSLRFVVGTLIDNTGPDRATFRVRFELPAGLSWGADSPDPSEGCTSTATTGECEPPSPGIPAGQGLGWFWDVVASAPGSYPLRAEIVASSPADPNVADNSASATVVVAPAAPAARVTAFTVTPRRPRAGSTVTVRAEVSRAGSPLTPTGTRCTGRVGRALVTATTRAQSGAIVCRYRTWAGHRGKTLRGTVAFTAGGTRFTRRFSVRLR